MNDEASTFYKDIIDDFTLGERLFLPRSYRSFHHSLDFQLLNENCAKITRKRFVLSRPKLSLKI